MVARMSVKMGLTKVSKPMYASEPDFVQQMNAQVKALKDDLEYIMEQFENVTPEIAKESLEPTLALAKTYTPHKTGALRDSGYVEIVGFRGQPRVEIGFAKGGNPRYAVLVHEMVEVPHAAPTRSKFLEAAVNEDVDNIIDRVADGYRRFMGV